MRDPARWRLPVQIMPILAALDGGLLPEPPTAVRQQLLHAGMGGRCAAAHPSHARLGGHAACREYVEQESAVRLPRYRWHLGCILLKMPAIFVADRPHADQNHPPEYAPPCGNATNTAHSCCSYPWPYDGNPYPWLTPRPPPKAGAQNISAPVPSESDQRLVQASLAHGSRTVTTAALAATPWRC